MLAPLGSSDRLLLGSLKRFLQQTQGEEMISMCAEGTRRVVNHLVREADVVDSEWAMKLEKAQEAHAQDDDSNHSAAVDER